MAMLKSNVSWPQSRRFKSKTEWEPIGFFSEALCNSTQFDLKLGFFSSTAINVLADGFAVFLYNGGRMRLIINDILSDNDISAISVGESDNELPFFDIQDITSLTNRLTKRDKHFFECLSWLIRHERIRIKIISPKNGVGIAHSKCGIFSDGINRVAFDGSCNFSRTALVSNIESISAFCDWDGQSDAYKCKDISEDFDITYSGNDENVTYLNTLEIEKHIASAFTEKDIKELLADEMTIMAESLSDDLPLSIKKILNNAREKVNTIVESINIKESCNDDKRDLPSFPFPSGPRSYQQKAFDNWRITQKGLFAMATGTGKTLTALNCLLEIYKRNGYYKAVILVPTLTLVDQWCEECNRFNFKNIIKVCSKNNKWRNQIDNLLVKENMKITGTGLNYIVISTYASFVRDGVFDNINSFPRKKTLLIADEAHNMGAGRVLDRLEGIKLLRRIGLSATPSRQFDEEGNKKLNEFFGVQNSYTFEYSMREAIDNGFLCRYYYYPHLVYLSDKELSDYLEISQKLAKYFNYDKGCFPKGNDILLALLLKRKRIIHKAENKEAVFESILKNRYKEKGNLRYTLVYVPEGNKPDDIADVFDTQDYIKDDDFSEHIIDRYSQIVCEISSKTTVRKFTSDSQDRDVMLEDFANGKLEVLMSMKCLDEGVDVPRSEMAIFCASTGNPRQFIQRRGRILRTHKDKPFACIHDLVVAPIINSASESYNMERSLLRSELRRVRDFASLSENADAAYSELENIVDYYNLSIL